MVPHGLKTILCAGNGVSLEPRALAEVGFNVTVLDLSPTAIRAAKATGLDPEHFHRFCGRDAVKRSGGHLDFVVENLLNKNLCPGPFVVIIERRTVQRFPEGERPAALEALAARLSQVGILVSHCNDPNCLETRFHSSESWFRERNWTTWDGVPGDDPDGWPGCLEAAHRATGQQAANRSCEIKIKLVRSQLWPRLFSTLSINCNLL